MFRFAANLFFIYSYLYWVDDGQVAKLERSFLDGSSRSTLVKDGIVSPRALTIDFSTHDVYWIDSVLDSIQVSQCAFMDHFMKLLHIYMSVR